MYLKGDIKELDMSDFQPFDAIVVDPPWSEYSNRANFHGIQKQMDKSENWSL